jgi:hypothetical protein
MQRGPLLQPLRSTELVLSGPPRAHPSGCVQPFRLRRAQHRQAHRGSHCLSFVGIPLSHLSRSTEEANPPSGRVFLSAFAQQKPHSFPRGKPPASGPLPPSANTPHPFSPKLSRFVCWRHKPRQPRVSANLCCGVVHSRAEPDENPSSDTRKGFLWAQLFRSREHLIPCRRYLNAPPAEVAATRLRRIRLPCRGRGMLGIRFRLRRFRPLALQRSAIPPRRGQISKLWNFCFQPLELRAEFFQSLENHQSAFANAWGPRCAAPHKMGPRALRAPCFSLF